MPETPRARQFERSGRTVDGRQPPAIAVLHFPDVLDAAGSTAIPNRVLDNHRLSPETRLVYVMLRRLAMTSRGRSIDQRELARLIRIPVHRISSHLTLLERSGHIQVRADRRSDAQTALRYRLAEPARLEGDLPAQTAAMTPQSQRRRVVSGSAELRLVDRLIVMGVDPQVAGRLVAIYPKERVAGALRAAHRRRPRPRDPAAWVVAAIRQGWVTQNAAVAARQRQATEEQAIFAWEQRADAALSALPPETQQSLRRQAIEVVERRFGQRLAATTIGAMLITAEVRRLVAEQAGIPPPDAMSLPI
jgi:hypothetical protein